MRVKVLKKEINIFYQIEIAKNSNPFFEIFKKVSLDDSGLKLFNTTRILKYWEFKFD